MNFNAWIVFAALSLVWGASFLWIGIALDEHITPMTVATIRVGLGLLGLLVVCRLRRIQFPREARVWLLFVGTGVLNVALPFPLISWAETRIDSSMAAVLNGTVPLFTTIFAHVCFHDEKLTFRRVVGLLCGFGGVLVLSSKAFTEGGRHTTLPGVAAMLGAVVCYAGNNVYMKHFLRGQQPLVVATLTILFAFVGMCPAWLILEHPVHLPVLPMTWLALSWLGFLGVSAAYVYYFALIEKWGPSRASTVAYVFPVVGMILGIVFRGEHPTWRLFGGAAMILFGLWFVSRRRLKPASNAAV